ncbi:MAG: ATP-binding protein [Dissulfurimicrobium sp.]|uniref:ATP-binding protein n=1 Tax=Dissulfurimicrobium TaxID=1769732 RepID=UPI001EDBAEAB|nr:AAA family ATPase [Dissulfurimicrobium hydrothermale]UKL13398.1 AAA family ATPase [Dissulfurimicrobium hydrothermale]
MIFPFTAIVGQDEMKTGLILNVINPSIGGLLIMGEKGTAKSTAVRALAELLPEIDVVKGCPFNCDPDGLLCSGCREILESEGSLERERKKMEVVELPLGITEDRLIGTLDIEHAIKKGEKRFEPGILAAANRNFLYVDEVNLLEDHIVDLLLDSAAMGVNTVEREGVSFTHPARFILVGTMNPEEGDLRPQLLDRFGLCVQVGSIQDKAKRVEILRRRAAFDADPEAFAAVWQPEQDGLSKGIMAAKGRLGRIIPPDAALERIVGVTTSLELDGHRADIVMMKAAMALAAFRGRVSISDDDIRDVAQLALSHRMKRLPFEEMGVGMERLETALTGVLRA